MAVACDFPLQSPPILQVYYELYMDVFDSLGYLEIYFSQLAKGGLPVADLYHKVQSAGQVLVRQYLLITAGSVYVRTGQAPAKVVLRDLLDMTKGVQHPQRGLFLRYYLSQKMKDKLPDGGSAYEGAGGTLRDALGFLLANFSEMNRLWVRMQHGIGAGSKGRKRRERERQELRILVGSNLTRLSQLGGLTLPLYAEQVLPRVLTDVIVGCRDEIAQGYLLDSILAVFPVEYHVATLDALLDACGSILPRHGVVKATLTSLLTRIKEAALDGQLVTSAAGSGHGDEGSMSGSTGSGVLLPLSLDVFGRVLRKVTSLALDPVGPFSATAAAQAAAAAAESGAPLSGAAAAGAPNGAATAAPGSGESLGSLIEIYTALLDFAFAVYPPGTSAGASEADATSSLTAGYANDVLASAAGALGRLLYGDAYPALAAGQRLTAEGDDEAALAPLPVRSLEASAALSRLLGKEVPASSASSDAAASDVNCTETSTSSSTAAAAAAAAAAASTLDSPTSPSTESLSPPLLPPSPGMSEESSRLLVDLLARTQTVLGLGVLGLESHAQLVRLLRPAHQRAVANRLLAAVLTSDSRVTSPATARRLFRSLAPLMSVQPSASAAPSSSSSVRLLDAETEAEQRNIARLILHKLGGPSDVSAAGHVTVPGLEIPGLNDEAAAAAADGTPVATTSSGSGQNGVAASPSSPSGSDVDAHFAVLRVVQPFLAAAPASHTPFTHSALVWATLGLARRARSAAAEAAKAGVVSEVPAMVPVFVISTAG